MDNRRASVVKLADRLHNLRRIDGLSEQKLQRLHHTTERDVLPLIPVALQQAQHLKRPRVKELSRLFTLKCLARYKQRGPG